MRFRLLVAIAVLSALALPAIVVAAPPSPGLLERMDQDPTLAATISETLKDASAAGMNEPATSRLDIVSSPFGVPQIKVVDTPVTTGSVKTLVLLVDFPDEPAQTQAAFFDDFYFADEFGPASMRGYFREVSYGTPDAQGLLDIVTHNSPSVIGWIRLPHPLSYYTDGAAGMGVHPAVSARQMVEDAVAAVDHAVNFSLYDNNGDGYVENLVVVHAGQDAAVTGNMGDIWSHAWETSATPLVDGVKVSRYSTSSEYLYAPGDMTVGTPAHEFGHTMGLTDLYDLDGSSEGVGAWSLMGSGNWNSAGAGSVDGNSPARLDPWSAMKLGWLQPQTVTGTGGSRSVPAAATSRTTSTWRLFAGGDTLSKEYFLLENRQKTGTDAGLPGSGLMIWHVDENMSDNTSDTCRLVDVEEAHGTPQSLDAVPYVDPGSNRGDAGDSFPGTAGTRAFTDFTDPAARTNSGGVSHLIVNQISDSGPVMTAWMGREVDRLLINGGAAYTNEWTVSLTSYVYNAVKMSVDTGSGFATAVGYKETYPVLLPSVDGTKTVQVKYLDKFNRPLVRLSATIGLDTVAPTITSLTSPSHPDSDVWYSAAPVLNWVASDDRGVAGYSCVLDELSGSVPDVTGEGVGGTVSYPDVDGGRYEFNVRVVDGAGNWSPVSRRVLMVDGIAPTSTSLPTGRYVAPTAVTIDAVDEHSGVSVTYYSLNGGPKTAYTESLELTATGIYTLKYYSEDAAGNVEPWNEVKLSVTQEAFPQVPVAGADRFATSVEVSKLGFPDGAATVLIATGRNWPDALGASSLAGALDAPVLLVERWAVPSVVASEIARLGATRAVIIGGIGAVDDDVELALSRIGSITSVGRIAGMDRYDTARKVAVETVKVAGSSYDGTILVATGGSYADALAASPIAAANKWPILLAMPSNGLSAEDKVFVNGISASHPATARAVIFGGGSAVSYYMYEDLFSVFGPGIEVIAGADRYDTAARIARWGVDSCGMNWEVPALATGVSPYDALSGGVVQGRNGSVLLLTKPTELSPFAAQCISENEPSIFQVRFLGGTSALTQSVRDGVAALFQ